MANNKNQHFVPQFHLRRWSPDGRSISVLHLASGRIIPQAPIKGQCSKAYLYGQDPEVESAINHLENAGARAIRSVIATELPPEERDAVALLTYASFQWGRTPAAAAELEAIATEMVRRVLKTPGVVGDAEAFASIDKVRVAYKEPVQNAMKMAAEIGHCLLDLEPHLIINESPVGFITNDVGVVFHNQWCEAAKGVGSRGFVAGGLQLFIPVTPRHMLLFADNRVYKIGVRKGPRVVRLADQQDAEALNRLQIEAAHHNVYFDGSVPTATSLASVRSAPRAPRHLQVRSQRAVTKDGSSELIHVFHEGSHVHLSLPWLKIRKDARQKPLDERLRSWRPKAMALDEMVRGPRRERYSPPPSEPKVWYPASD